MEQIKSHWYKILSVLLIIYVLIAGMCVPLKPGITAVSPSSIKAGTEAVLSIQGYNTHYKSSSDYNVWLKFDSIHLLKANKITALNENNIQASFKLPQYLPFNRNQGFASLIMDSELDGPSILPGKIYVKQDSVISDLSSLNWPKDKLALSASQKGFKYPYRNILNETIRNTFFHVAIWFAMFFLMILSFIQSIKYLRNGSFVHDIKASSYADVAITFGLIGIATGSVWAKHTWGTYWTSDVKLNMTAIAMLIYCAYWVLRGSITDIDNRSRVSAAYNIFAFLMLIPLIFVIPRLTDSLHPGNGGNPALGGEDLDNRLRMIFYPAILAYSMFGYWISNLFIRVKKIKEKSFLSDKK